MYNLHCVLLLGIFSNSFLLSASTLPDPKLITVQLFQDKEDDPGIDSFIEILLESSACRNAIKINECAAIIFRIVCYKFPSLVVKMLDLSDEIGFNVVKVACDIGWCPFKEACCGRSRDIVSRMIELGEEIPIDFSYPADHYRTTEGSCGRRFITKFERAIALGRLDVIEKIFELREKFSIKNYKKDKNGKALGIDDSLWLECIDLVSSAFMLKLFSKYGYLCLTDESIACIRSCRYRVKYVLLQQREKAQLGSIRRFSSLPELLLDIDQKCDDGRSSAGAAFSGDITSVKTFLKGKNSRLAFVLSALKHDTSRYPLERYEKETREELYAAYEAWLKHNDHNRLSNFFVYLGNKIKADQRRIAEGYFAADEDDDTHKKYFYDYDALYKEPIVTDDALDHQDLIVYIGKTFFKSIDHLVVILQVLSFIEEDAIKKDSLYNRINSLEKTYKDLAERYAEELSQLPEHPDLNTKKPEWLKALFFKDTRRYISLMESIVPYEERKKDKLFDLKRWCYEAVDRWDYLRVIVRGDLEMRVGRRGWDHIKYSALMHDEGSVTRFLKGEKVSFPSSDNEYDMQRYYFFKYVMPSMVELSENPFDVANAISKELLKLEYDERCVDYWKKKQFDNRVKKEFEESVSACDQSATESVAQKKSNTAQKRTSYTSCCVMC